MNDGEIRNIQKSLLEFFDPDEWPTLCADRSKEGLAARDLLHDCSIPFHYWNAEEHPPDLRPPFMIFKGRTALGLQEIEGLCKDYANILRAYKAYRAWARVQQPIKKSA